MVQAPGKHPPAAASPPGKALDAAPKARGPLRPLAAGVAGARDRRWGTLMGWAHSRAHLLVTDPCRKQEPRGCCQEERLGGDAKGWVEVPGF